jgi:hypothetical protein
MLPPPHLSCLATVWPTKWRLLLLQRREFLHPPQLLLAKMTAPLEILAFLEEVDSKELKLWRSKLLERDRWCFELDGILD